jgi:hypothetical protein
MIDIVSVGDDIGIFDTQNFRAANILSVQIGNLDYAPDLGIDLRYFLSEEFRFQNESFKAYLIQVLANYAINVASVIDTVENLHRQYTFNLVPAESDGGMIAR